MIDPAIPTAREESDRRRNSSDSDWPAGGGEMGSLIRSFDWSATSLGPMDTWSQSLKTAVNILLLSPVPIVMLWGPDGIMIYNDSYSVFAGGRHPGLLGSKVLEGWPEVAEFNSNVMKVGLSGKTLAYRDQHLVLYRHGIAEDVWMNLDYSPVLDESGRPAGVLAIVVETTRRVIGERRLRTLREVGLRTASAGTVEAVSRTAMEAMQSENRADLPYALFYVLKDESHVRLVASYGAEPRTEALEFSLLSTHEWVTAFATVRETGQARDHPAHSLVSGAPTSSQLLILPITAGTSVAGFLVVGLNPSLALESEYRDFLHLLAAQISKVVSTAKALDEERRRAQALAELNRVKTAFFSNVSHEFRTPLTLMLGPVEDLLAAAHRTDLPPFAQDQLKVVHRNGHRLLRLVNSLLDFSRIEADRVQARFEPTDLATFTADLASAFQSAAERAGLRLVVNCPPLAEPVYVDRDMWEKVVLNLMSNAFKFTFQGEIEVALRPCGEGSRFVELSVRDTGIGIASEELPRIFERFHRVEGASGRTHEGTGIGLALVQELVKLHGGVIEARSRTGEGSTFAVRLPLGAGHLPVDRVATGTPLAPSSAEAAPYIEEALGWLPDSEANDELGMSNEESESAHSTFHTPHSSFEEKARSRVLVVDDNADMRRYLVRLLVDQYDVEAVPDGEAALAAARAHPPDVILTDVMMPRLDGFGLLRGLRADPATKTIPVIFLSARAGEESHVEGLERGADDYLIKPFSARELLARVASHVEMARLRREAEREIARGRRYLERIAASTPDMLFVFDLIEGKNIYINRSLESVLGYVPEQIESMTWVPNFVHPEDMAGVRQWCARFETAADEQILQHELRVRHADGSYRWILVRATAFERTPDGRVKRIVGVASDVTERKCDEEAKDRLAAIVESSDDAIISKDLNSVIASWNAGAERLFGYTAQEAIGRSITMLMPPERLHEEAVILGRIRRGERMEHFETVRRRKDGTLLDISLTVSPIINAQGRIVGASKIARDITGRKRQEADLIARSMQQRLLYELSDAVNRAGALTDLYDKALDVIIGALHADRAAILLFDDDGVMRFKAWRGLSSDYRRTVEGHSPWQRNTSDPRTIVVGDIAEAEIAPELQETIRREGIQALSFIPITCGGRLLGKFMVYFNRRHTMNEEEVNLARAIAGTLALGIERKTTEEALRRLNDELEARIDTRTRELVASQARLRALAADLNLAEQRERQRLATELHDYLAQLLALSKIKLGQAKQLPMSEPLSKSLTEIQGVMDQALAYTRSLVAQLSPPVLHQFGLPSALKWLAEQMKERNLEVVLDLQQEISPLPEDQAVLLFQSVRELLINVSKHGRTQQAKVTVSEEEGLLRIVVTDRGTGFNLAAVTSAGSAPQSPAAPGFGLFSIRERMAALGGQFSITSAPGQGTTAGLTLPLNPKTGNDELGMRNDESGMRNEELGMGSQSDDSSFHIPHSSFQKDAVIRVLLVDDHAMVRQGLRGLLDGYPDIQVVGEATNGEEALTLSATLAPHVILMDVNMPKMDGVEATKRLARAGSDIRIIGLSVDNHAHIEQTMRDAGAAAFHTKEAAVEALYQSIHAVIGK